MRILFVNQYYWPDVAATAQHLADLCTDLVRRGHRVEVLASRRPYDPHAAGGSLLPRREVHQGVIVRRLSATGFGKRSPLGRAIDYLSFHLLTGLRVLLTAGRYDAVVTLTTPPLIGLYATWSPARCLGRTRHICWAMDLHPDLEFELGIFDRRRWWARLLDRLNTAHLRRADTTVALGRDMKRRLENKGVPGDRIEVISPWGHDEAAADDRPGQPPPGDLRANPLRSRLGLDGKFVVMYSGNAGVLHTFDAILAAARTLRDDPLIRFLFVGGGRRMDEVRTYRQAHQLNNLLLHDYVPRQMLAHSLAVGDVHLACLRDGVQGLAVPSKLYGIFAAARPVLFIGPEDCESAMAVRESDAGRVVAPDDPDSLVRLIRELARDHALRDRLARNARTAFDAQYSATVCCQRWAALLQKRSGYTP